jgi:NAD+ kinase
MKNSFLKIGCIADFSSVLATNSYKSLIAKYPLVDANSLDIDKCDVIVALGGDGLMLKVLHRFIGTGIPVYGMNRGSIGFLMNSYSEDNLYERLESAVVCNLYPLEMKVTTTDNEIKSFLAINEVSLLRQTNQAAKIRITINQLTRLETLVCDGILVSTPAGSTAYNFAANGPIVPITSNILPLTPISAFRPRRWRGALLSNKDKIRFDILNPSKRPVSAVADFHEVREVASVEVRQVQEKAIPLLFDSENNIEERVLKEQFMP